MKKTSKMTGFSQRLTTAIVFASVMLFGILFGPFTFGLLFGIILVLCLHEFFNLLLPRPRIWIYFFGLMYGLLPYLVLFATKAAGVHSLTPEQWAGGLLSYGVLGFSTLVIALYQSREEAFSRVGLIILGALYLGFAFSCLLWMGWDGSGYHRNWVLGLLLFTWINDTGAYMIGSQVGKRPFFPRISPKKTWEGTIGGWIFTIGLGLGLGALFSEPAWHHWMIVGGIAAVFGSIGDLVESMLKRQAGVKDSGTWMPGHGGALDRFDAFLFILPFVTLYWFFFI